MRNISKNVIHYYSDELQKKLQKVLTTSTTIVEAPTGYGKTTMIRDLMESQKKAGCYVKWITVGQESEEDLRQRFHRAIGSIDIFAGELIQSMDCSTKKNDGKIAHIIRSLKCEKKSYLVFDNFEYLEKSFSDTIIQALIQHGGDELHIILIKQAMYAQGSSVIESLDGYMLNARDLKLTAADIQKYYHICNIAISLNQAKHIEEYTEGWMMAVYLQLLSYCETGSFICSGGVLQLMNNLVWEKLDKMSRYFLMLVSPFDSITLRQACHMLETESLPEYIQELLINNPFVKIFDVGGRYEMHRILNVLSKEKLAQETIDFQKKVAERIGEWYFLNNQREDAIWYFLKACNYERILNIELSGFDLSFIGKKSYGEVAEIIIKNCSELLFEKYPISIFRLGRSLYAAGNIRLYEETMKKMHRIIWKSSLIEEEKRQLQGEWMICSSLMDFTNLKKMYYKYKYASELMIRPSEVIKGDEVFLWGAPLSIMLFQRDIGKLDETLELIEKAMLLYRKLTNGIGNGEIELLRAETALLRGHLEEAEILCYKAIYIADNKKQLSIKQNIAYVLALIQLYGGDVCSWNQPLEMLNDIQCSSVKNKAIVKMTTELIQTCLFASISAENQCNNDITKGYLDTIHITSMSLLFARYTYAVVLIERHDYHKMIGFMEMNIEECKERGYSYAQLQAHILVAVGYQKLNNLTRAKEHIKKAVYLAIPDMILTDFISAVPLYDLYKECIPKGEEEFYQKIQKGIKRYKCGWNHLHTYYSKTDIRTVLGERELEIAQLAVQGLNNTEIANKLFLSVNTVKMHLKNVFRKLDINKRTELVNKL